MPRGVDQVVDQHRGDDLPAQLMLADVAAELVSQAGREVPRAAGRRTPPDRAVRWRARRPSSASLTCAISVASSGDVSPSPSLGSPRDLLLRRQRLEFTVEPALGDKVLDHAAHAPAAGWPRWRDWCPSDRSGRRCLTSTSGQPRRSSTRSRSSPVFGPHLASGDQRVDQDLDVDLVVGAIDTRRVVHRVGVAAAAGQVELDRDRARSRPGCRPRRSPWRAPGFRSPAPGSLARSPTSASDSVSALM